MQKRKYKYKDVYFNKTNVIIIIITLFLLCCVSTGYSILSTTLEISGNVSLLKEKVVKFVSLTNPVYVNSGYDVYNPTFTNDTLSFNIELPNINSTVSYTVTLQNNKQVTMQLVKILNQTYSNNDIEFVFTNLKMRDYFDSDSTTTFVITFRYKDTVTTVNNSVINAIISFQFDEYEEAPFAYVQNGLLLNLRGIDSPINGVWYDNYSSTALRLNDVSYNDDTLNYDFTSGGYGRIANSIIPSTGDFTLEALIKLPSTFSTSEDDAIIAQVSDSSNDSGRFKLNLRYKNGKYLIQVFLNNTALGSNSEFEIISNVLTDTIYFFQVVRSGSTLYCYLNGALAGTFDLSSSASISTGPFKLGRWNTTGSQSFKGEIFAVRVYNRVLSSQELLNNRKADNYYYLHTSLNETILSYAVNNYAVSSGDGLYNINGNYVFKGTDPNNYLKIQGDNNTYRIVSFNNDGSMKIINVTDRINYPYDVSESRNPTTSTYCLGALNFAEDTQTYYGCNAWQESESYLFKNDGTDIVAKDASSLTRLEEYYDDLVSNVKSKIITHVFNAGLVGEEITLSTMRTQAASNQWIGNIGLIGIDDMLNASTSSSCNKLNSSSTACSSYLTSLSGSEIGVWTINGASTNSWDVWAFVAGNNIGKRRASRYYQAIPGTTRQYVFYLHPTFYISSDYEFLGTGTSVDPFVIE